MERAELSTQYEVLGPEGGAVVIRPPHKIQGKSGEEGRVTPSLEERRALLGEEEKRELITVLLAARLLGKSRDTIYRWLDGGRLAGRRVGGRWLVYKDAVEKEWKAGLVGPEEG